MVPGAGEEPGHATAPARGAEVGEPDLFTSLDHVEHLLSGAGLGDHLVFGKETVGLPPEILDRYPDRTLSLPLIEGERSLNVATAVCAAVYLAAAKMVDNGQIALTDHGSLPGS